jgi:hypothetical protein
MVSDSMKKESIDMSESMGAFCGKFIRELIEILLQFCLLVLQFFASE